LLRSGFAFAFAFFFAFDLHSPLPRRDRSGSVRKDGAHDARQFVGGQEPVQQTPLRDGEPAQLHRAGAASGAASLTTGILPFAASQPAALFARLLPRRGYFSSLLKKSNPLAIGEWKLSL
jgi:hypothetical protein